MSCPDDDSLMEILSADVLLRFHLASTPGMGPVSLKRLLDRFGTVERIFASTELELRNTVRKDLATNIFRAARNTGESQEVLETLISYGARILYPDSSQVPSRLSRQTGAWHFLIHIGDPHLWNPPPVVGMVGRRQASTEGIEFAQELACEFARRGVVTLSGMAQGIDRASHFGSLAGNGSTVAVLPMGILQFMREISHWKLIRNAVEAGRMLLVSGAPPLQGWSVAEAMRRNQWIANWCDALVVVEAGDKGGTWKTASCAVHFKRPVWVASGFVTMDAGLGNKAMLMKLGAHRLDTNTSISCLAGEILASCTEK